ncbi:hypothetical protein A1Q1_00228 [Trichosporon asahii var. asahii CBS 2479]|uniref:Uncharacterized protein n=1 Tax=Trichosporon asahii var. asahii (strain ATCC 90039 / CBS 2479 / JCM 2466 / KCTC 7840 / NBRC 103889/ NCYC 2677 / UAMH 7654) TaxID=1186058 RepID=J4UG77_TRIAS|nr:hypothetical protein A1Q1_00228 [Trichosporon asahii var. asahii CBS 2479]EJT50460.1 hypothetical protein A1Q1_00228 [Trichosporon asahii var. asahii CBS 2479]
MDVGPGHKTQESKDGEEDELGSGFRIGPEAALTTPRSTISHPAKAGDPSINTEAGGGSGSGWGRTGLALPVGLARAYLNPTQRPLSLHPVLCLLASSAVLNHPIVGSCIQYSLSRFYRAPDLAQYTLVTPHALLTLPYPHAAITQPPSPPLATDPHLFLNVSALPSPPLASANDSACSAPPTPRYASERQCLSATEHPFFSFGP